MSDQNDSISNLPPREILHQTALKAPASSGVYLWHNADDKVIYVGKAKNLKNRLCSYFSGNKDIKTKLLINHARRIEYIRTNNEYEAFLLENNLIKKYSPRYNINLKDGKSYPVLKITAEKFPRIYKTRHVVKDSSLYFGPFPDASSLDTFIETLYEIYPLRHCRTFREKETPCMYYHIGRCLGPCYKKISQSTYTEFIEEISTLLEGKGESTAQKIENQMKDAAKNLNFEKAARLRDGLKALSILQNQNIVENFGGDDRDYIAHFRDGEHITFTVLKMREGKLLGRDNYNTLSLNEDSEILPEFLCAYYTDKNAIPPHIYVSSQEGMENIKKWFLDTCKTDTDIVLVNELSPQSKLHLAALNMARENAKEELIRQKREEGDICGLRELKDLLKLEKLPLRIEGFDIAHIGGKFPVASLISFYKGNPDKKNYRYFRLKTTDGYIDDFASMQEAVSRRYTRLLNDHKPLPDLILIDGGIGQVNAVDSILKSLGLEIPIAGLAKRDEEIYRPHNSTPLSLPKRSDGLRLLQRVRDETHRFATSRNQELRTKENTISAFSALPHTGPKREKLLLIKYSTLENLSKASEAEIAQLLNLKGDKAADILLMAKNLYAKEKEAKENAMLSLDLAGTTKEKAARYKINQSLAEEALFVAAGDDDDREKDDDNSAQ